MIRLGEKRRVQASEWDSRTRADMMIRLARLEAKVEAMAAIVKRIADICKNIAAALGL
jgi:hypothetical protein